MELSIYTGISNIVICILLYKFIIDLILYFNSEYYNQELIQRKFVQEFIFGSSIFTMTYLLVTYNYFNINKIKYGLYLCSILLLFESIFINWNYLTADTKLTLLGITLIIIISLNLTRFN